MNKHTTVDELLAEAPTSLSNTENFVTAKNAFFKAKDIGAELGSMTGMKFVPDSAKPQSNGAITVKVFCKSPLQEFTFGHIIFTFYPGNLKPGWEISPELMKAGSDILYNDIKAAIERVQRYQNRH